MRLGVNIDHVATVREARGGVPYPEPVEAALLAESGGADGITVHLRIDRRHIKERDIRILKEVVKTHLNVEASLDPEIQEFLLDVKPHWVCLVPERPGERTTEGGLDLTKVEEEARRAVDRLKEKGIKVTIFVEPDAKIIEIAKRIGADAVEINTGKYAEGVPGELKRIEDAAGFAASCGLEVHGGHGLHYHNVVPVASIPEIVELNIGHSIVARAIMVGMERAVREMKNLLLGARKWNR